MSAVTIKETRRLLLPLETVLEALVHFDRRSNGVLSQGEVLQVDCVTDKANGDGIEVALRKPGGEIEWKHLGVADISAAIISYCRGKRIPLPYAGAKSISVARDGVTFSIENQVDIAQRAEVRADLAGRPLRYAKGYEPHAIVPVTNKEAYV